MDTISIENKYFPHKKAYRKHCVKIDAKGQILVDSRYMWHLKNTNS